MHANVRTRGIAMFVHALDGRSVARVVMTLRDAIEELGVPCSIITVRTEGQSSAVSERVVVLGGPGRPTMAVLPRLQRSVTLLQPAALVAHVSGPNLAAALGRAIGLLRVPRLALVEHVEWVTHPNWRYRRLRALFTRTLYPRADVVIGVSPDVCAGLQLIAPGVRGKVVVIPPPLIAQPRPQDTFPGASDPWFSEDRSWPLVVTVGNVIPVRITRR